MSRALRQARRPARVRLLLQAALLVAVPSIAALAFNEVRSRGLPLVAEDDYTDDILVPCPETLIEPTAVRLADLPDPVPGVIIDARSLGEYLSGHALGAISMPYQPVDAAGDDYGLDTVVLRRLQVLNPPVLVYGDERIRTGHDLAALLLEQGVNDVRYLVEGWSGWEGSGRPVERAASSVRAVTVDALPEALEALTVVDARFSRYYRRGHLPGAVAVSYLMLEGPDDPRLDPLRPHSADPVLVYGSAGHDDGEGLARLLAAAGFVDVRYLEGGFEAWEAAGRPVER